MCEAHRALYVRYIRTNNYYRAKRAHGDAEMITIDDTAFQIQD